jgi:H+-translocating NAD(P) transhydrogenase subunit beta
MADFLINIAYLLGALAFLWGLRLLSSPDTARRGNLLAGAGMALAIVAAMAQPMTGAANNYAWIAAAMAVGALIGLISARRVKMTDMPQMVSVFNGLGGACAVVLAYAELMPFYAGSSSLDMAGLAIVLLALFIGGVSFTGSMLAFAKLQGLIWDSTLRLPKHNLLNMVLLLLTLGLGAYLAFSGISGGLALGTIFMVLALIYGFSFVIPIGGADMPVVISLLNSLTGLSAAVTGLIYNSQFMLVGGILVGASGTILTVLMCQAMNRPLLNVLIGGFGGDGSGGQSADGSQVAREVTLNDAAIQLFYASSAIIVPGYGLAVAQAQKICREVEDLLEKNGVNVRYAIHPVAGRMPGHMNVLLAEADVSYNKLLDLEESNEAFRQTDMVVIVGANDVVNPAAKDDASSPIYGMPVLQVWESKNVIVLKRSMRPGYAGIENPLFFHERTRMLFGDAKETLGKLASEIKGL